MIFFFDIHVFLVLNDQIFHAIKRCKLLLTINTKTYEKYICIYFSGNNTIC